MTCSISGGCIAKYGYLEQNKLNWIILLLTSYYMRLPVSKKLIITYVVKKFHSFTESEGSLPYSQLPTTEPHSESAVHILTPYYYEMHFHIILGLSSGPLFHDWWLKFFIFLISTIHVTCPINLVLLNFIKLTILIYSDTMKTLWISSLCSVLQPSVIFLWT
jgi:hypothetical protein